MPGSEPSAATRNQSHRPLRGTATADTGIASALTGQKGCAWAGWGCLHATRSTAPPLRDGAGGVLRDSVIAGLGSLHSSGLREVAPRYCGRCGSTWPGDERLCFRTYGSDHQLSCARLLWTCLLCSRNDLESGGQPAGVLDSARRLTLQRALGIGYLHTSSVNTPRSAVNAPLRLFRLNPCKLITLVPLQRLRAYSCRPRA